MRCLMNPIMFHDRCFDLKHGFIFYSQLCKLVHFEVLKGWGGCEQDGTIFSVVAGSLAHLLCVPHFKVIRILLCSLPFTLGIQPRTRGWAPENCSLRDHPIYNTDFTCLSVFLYFRQSQPSII